MSNDISRILNADDKAINETHGVLSRLFRKILFDRNIKPSEFTNLMIRFLSDTTNGFYNDGKRRSSERSNLIKEISRQTMTWKVFRKCIKFLNPLEMELIIRLKWRDVQTNDYFYTDHSIGPIKVGDETYQHIADEDEDD